MDKTLGGSNQGMAPAAATPTSAGGSGISGIRCHEKNGEVHFHDDAGKMKVAVPVSQFHNMWSELENNAAAKPSYVDNANNTRVSLSWSTASDGTKDIRISVTSSIGETYKILEKIISGKP